MPINARVTGNLSFVKNNIVNITTAIVGPIIIFTSHYHYGTQLMWIFDTFCCRNLSCLSLMRRKSMLANWIDCQCYTHTQPLSHNNVSFNEIRLCLRNGTIEIMIVLWLKSTVAAATAVVKVKVTMTISTFNGNNYKYLHVTSNYAYQIDRPFSHCTKAKGIKLILANNAVVSLISFFWCLSRCNLRW